MKKLTTILFVALVGLLQAQIDPQISQHMMHKAIYNPSAIYASNYIDANLLVRQQWTGFDNAPSTQILHGSYFIEKYNFGLGLSFINDQVGIENHQQLKVKYAYRFVVYQDIELSLGIGAGFFNRHLKTGELIFEDQNDPYTLVSENKFRADFDFGLEVSNEHFSIGFSSTHIANSPKKSDISRIPRHHYLYVSYFHELNDDISVMPYVFLRNCKNITQYELGSLVKYRDFIWAGIAYRIQDAFVGMVKLKVMESLLVSYSYDFVAGKLQTYNSGSHEISLSVLINKNSGISRSPRFFD